MEYILIIGGSIVLYILCAWIYAWPIEAEYYSTNGIVLYNNDIAKGLRPRIINKCSSCGYLWSNYYLHEYDIHTCGCPKCTHKKFTKVGAKIREEGSIYKFNQHFYWEEI